MFSPGETVGWPSGSLMTPVFSQFVSPPPPSPGKLGDPFLYVPEYYLAKYIKKHTSFEKFCKQLVILEKYYNYITYKKFIIDTFCVCIIVTLGT